MKIVLEFGMKELKRAQRILSPILERLAVRAGAIGPLQAGLEAVAQGLSELQERVEGVPPPPQEAPPPPAGAAPTAPKPVVDEPDLPSSGEALAPGTSVWDSVDEKRRREGLAAPEPSRSYAPGAFGRGTPATPYELALDTLSRTHGGSIPKGAVERLRKKFKDDPAVLAG